MILLIFWHVSQLQWAFKHNLNNFFIIYLFAHIFFSASGYCYYSQGSHKVTDQLHSQFKCVGLISCYLSNYISEMCSGMQDPWGQRPHLIHHCTPRSSKVINIIRILQCFLNGGVNTKNTDLKVIIHWLFIWVLDGSLISEKSTFLHLLVRIG